MHGHVRFLAVRELQGCVLDFGDLAPGRKPWSQICHEHHLTYWFGEWLGDSVLCERAALANLGRRWAAWMGSVDKPARFAVYNLLRNS